ncbi:MAG: glutamine amidotransferase [Burkholderiaceae bacterium]|jgi:GMP synthase (glutamine-hydrolysing)|nr:glutamine amidotransferase [Burkholderiaceae bacterium]
MKTAIALRHIHFEDIGTLHGAFSEHGYEVRYVDPALDPLDAPELQQADLLLVLGGPIGVDDEETYPFLKTESALIGQRLRAKRPLLGICLGAQLIAKALGARVYSMGVKEIGFAPLTLTAAGQNSALAALGDAPVLHWHGDQFDIPEGAHLLAGTPVCANQAFSIGRHVLGLQFHLEADANKIEKWLLGHACELAQSGIDPRQLRADAAHHGKRLAFAAHTVISAWLGKL